MQNRRGSAVEQVDFVPWDEAVQYVLDAFPGFIDEEGVCDVCDQTGDLAHIQGFLMHVDCAPAQWKTA
ncbi:MAG TPA: hypothetical protein VFV13_16070 [Acidimicrobiia bacterium]|nr:hypothetical protein [Acidimicrobiia bacterium]